MAAPNLKVSFTKVEVRGGHAEYDIQVSDSEQTWTLTARYSRLDDLHAELKAANKNKELPKFPGKKLFGNNDPAFLSQRQKGLEHYVQTLLKSTNQYDIRILVQYLMSGKKQTNKAPSANVPDKDKKEPQLQPKPQEKKVEQEVLNNFSKRLVQVLKKDENYLLDDQNEVSKNREIVTQRQVLDRKLNFRIVGFAEDVDLEDPVLKKVMTKAASQLNEVLKAAMAPLPESSEFVQKIQSN